MMALWLARQDAPFLDGPTLNPSQVTVIGRNDDQHSVPMGLQSLPLTEVRRLGPRSCARQALQAIPDEAPILVHFDIDVLNKQEMPASYFPPANGLNMAEAREQLGIILTDTRVRIIEASEYSSLRDFDQTFVPKIGEILAAGLGASGMSVNK